MRHESNLFRRGNLKANSAYVIRYAIELMGTCLFVLTVSADLYRLKITK